MVRVVFTMSLITSTRMDNPKVPLKALLFPPHWQAALSSPPAAPLGALPTVQTTWPSPPASQHPRKIHKVNVGEAFWQL